MSTKRNSKVGKYVMGRTLGEGERREHFTSWNIMQATAYNCFTFNIICVLHNSTYCFLGTFGKVKHAENSETGEHVAIKVLDKMKIQQQNMGSQIKREISLMKMVKNPHIVQLHVSDRSSRLLHGSQISQVFLVSVILSLRKFQPVRQKFIQFWN